MDQTKFERLLEEIEKAETIIVGIGPDISAKSGVNFKADDSAFNKYFADFKKKFFLKNIESGIKFKWAKPENKWAFTALLLQYLRDTEPGQPYEDLKKLLEGKNFFAITPNNDGLAARALGDDHVTMLRGDYRWLQCEKGCTDAVYASNDFIDDVVANIDGCAVPTDKVPTCPECGKPLTPWVYGYDFLEGTHHKEQFERWNKFLEANINKKILFLQVGAGMKNQEYIKLPFWNMTLQHPDAFYVAIENQAAFGPAEIQEKCLEFEGDLAVTLRQAAELKA